MRELDFNGLTNSPDLAVAAVLEKGGLPHLWKVWQAGVRSQASSLAV
jgi:hypothetical protein